MTDTGSTSSDSQPDPQASTNPSSTPPGTAASPAVEQPSAVPPTQPTPAAPPQEWERTYAMFIHLTLLAAHILPLPVIGALIMWLIKRDESSFIDDHGREAVNFQISLLLYALAGFPLMFVCGIGIAVWVAVYILGLVGLILAAIAANKGQFYRYPVCLRFVK
jgi:uncharacterized Tic20 family protein